MNGPSLRIVRLANFVAPASGGLRTALRELGKGYREAGHQPVLIVPGERTTDRETAQGRVITLPGPLLPGTGGYRVLTDRRRVARLLEGLAPDRLEVCDRTTLRWTGKWARRARVPAVMVSHETADGVLRTWGVPEGAARRAADALNLRTAHTYARVVCTTEFAEREFVRIGARNVVRAPLGVDLVERHPALRDAGLRAVHARGDEIMLVMCTRLSVEKRPGTALDALEALLRRGVRAVLVVAGDGPLRHRLEQRVRERGLPVTFLGHVSDRGALGALQAAADVCLAPGPAETFGLAALEAMACGTPVVASASSALPEVIGAAGAVAADRGEAFADAVEDLLGRPAAERREAARARAECFGWTTAVDAFLAAHDAAAPTRVGGHDQAASSSTQAQAQAPVSTTPPTLPTGTPSASAAVRPFPPGALGALG
ncbi:GDP-mannose-dependent alpha-(1-6)-phosphatidylinositol dimannoside mannosyltransferase [Streptomyces humidus]|uniref:GDP-mannose-dependent alpha-(1-6)-phosphatidylinositol dimannoside mannosyltransferase n=1 Tax=Streptomyces humidus TaxID=52259 RepID=A0A918G6M8_9ACTN|nr:glycosyltransferase [Streptomyces humidus]GGS21356.1 GDP-mannose-dependent alpha-(1-6)-phosphatidylinositol dimannoside mannosyltransferase [Streptomyces humidus]